MWYDGKCKKCGFDVEEGSNTTEQGGDYMNRCTNPSCVEHKWHSCYDSEFLDYYEHK